MLFFIPLLVFIVLLASKTAIADEQSDDILFLYEQLKNMEIDTSRAAKLENFSFKKDIVEWKFESGYIYLTKPFSEFPDAGGAYFIGKGKMIFEPPSVVEREQLKRHTEKERFNEPFNEAYFRFNDDTRSVFEPLMKPVSNTDAGDFAEKFQERQKALSDLLFNLEFPVIQDSLSEVPRNPYLFIECDIDKLGLIAFSYSPMNLEEIAIFKRKKLGFGATAFGNFITAFHRKEDYESGIDLDYEDKDLIDITHYDMDLTIEPGSLLMHAKVKLHFKPLTDKLSTIAFPLLARIDPERHDKIIMINSIADQDGNQLPYIYKNFNVLIQLPRAFNKGDTIVLNFDYDGDFIRPDPPVNLPPGYKLDPSLDFLPESESTFTLLNTYPWFPQYGYLRRYTFDLTLRVPKPYTAVGSGTTIKRWEEGNYNCLHSKEDTPVALASLLFGKYYTIKDDSKRPAIYVHSLFKQQRQAEAILQESRTIVDLYEQYFGPFPYDEFDVAQMGFGYGFGQAPPGLVQLTGEAFLGDNEMQAIPWARTGKVGFRAGFLSHEIGHEWWGHVVGWRNYHEQWLSESFTEYMAGMYLEATKGTKEFEYKLNQWKEYAYSRKNRGPIWLGQRLQDGYFAALYFKGPYVLHMLRMALIWKFGQEDGNKLFFDALKNFCTEFRNQSPTTKDFQRVLKQTTKIDMDWFFDQWFREAGFPDLRVSYSMRQTEDGKYLAEVRVKQTDKDHLKTMIIPIFFHFSDGNVLRFDKPIGQQEETLLKFKFPEKPELMTVDDAKDLLATIEYE